MRIAALLPHASFIVQCLVNIDELVTLEAVQKELDLGALKHHAYLDCFLL